MLIYYVTDSQVPDAPPAVTENQVKKTLAPETSSSKTSD